MNTATQESNIFVKENFGSGLHFFDGGTEGPALSSRMKTEIDKDIEIAREQFRRGQYRRLDDNFVTEFLEEAHRRSAALFKKNA